MDYIVIWLERMRRALRFYFRLRYSWRMAWHKAGYYDGRLNAVLLDEHRDVSRCGAHTDIH